MMTIIAEWFDVASEVDKLACYEHNDNLADARRAAKWHLRKFDGERTIPVCVRIEDKDEVVVARYSWENGKVIKLG